MSGHFQAVPDPRWKIPPSEWGTVVHRVEQEEPLRQVAHDYGVSYEAVRRVLRAARRREWYVWTSSPTWPGHHMQRRASTANSRSSQSKAPGLSSHTQVFSITRKEA
jgi:hypothetical protein